MKLSLVVLIALCAVAANAQVIPDILNLHSWLAKPNTPAVPDLSNLQNVQNSLVNIPAVPELPNMQNWEVNALEGLNPQSPGLLEGLVNNIFAKIKEYTDQNILYLESELEKLVNKFVSQMFFVSQFALVKVEDQQRDAKARLITSKSVYAKNCSAMYIPKLDDVVADGKKNVEGCVTGAIGGISLAQKKVQTHIDAIKLEVLKLFGIFQKCVDAFKPLSTIKCIVENVGGLWTSVKDIVASAYDALKDATGEFSNVVSDGSKCIRTFVNDTEFNLKPIVGAIDTCLNPIALVKNASQLKA